MNPNVSLNDATRALRATSGVSHDAEGTRQRVLGTVTRRKRVRRHLIAVATSVLLGFPFGATAYAAFFGTPAFVRAWIQQLAPSAATSSAATSSAATPSAAVHAPRAPAQSVDVASPAPALDPVSAAEVMPTTESASTVETTPTAPTTEVAAGPLGVPRQPTPSTSRRERPAVAATASIASTTPSSTKTPDTDALYARAHELHFVARNPQAALDAWNDYLARVPSAALSLEAQYNRALCLVRLHQNDDALTALAPFADGTHGNYRRREALALTQALMRSASR